MPEPRVNILWPTAARIAKQWKLQARFEDLSPHCSLVIPPPGAIFTARCILYQQGNVVGIGIGEAQVRAGMCAHETLARKRAYVAAVLDATVNNEPIQGVTEQ